MIRYASEDEIEKKEPFKFTARMKGYTAILAILVGILIGLLFLRNDVEANILRLPGQLYQHKGENISNIYTYKIINKTNNDFNDVHFKLVGIKGSLKLVGNQSIKVPKQGMKNGTLFVEINQYLLESDKTTLKIEVYEGSKKVVTSSTSFLSPRTFD